MARGISLANKCQLLFGAAVVLIVISAMVGPWIRLGRIVDEAQLESSRQIAEAWTRSQVADPDLLRLLNPVDERAADDLAPSLDIDWWAIDAWEAMEAPSGFLSAAQSRLAKADSDAAIREHSQARWDGAEREYRYARLVSDDSGAPLGVVVVERRSRAAADQVVLNRLLLIIAGLVAGALAVLVFYLITTRIILSPVRSLKETAERVRAGDLESRADLKTGDEFEQLAEAFNAMLAEIVEQQVLLRGMNRSLEGQMSKLEERNMTLRDNARLKGEFLANISHELRTPLNSIIGFAEILQDIAHRDEESGQGPIAPEQLAKRKRYLDNIVSAGRSLLTMINELLQMAKIEAGNIEMHVQPVNVGETCEALVGLIKPLADRKNLRLELQLQGSREEGFTQDATRSDLPAIETDQQKFHQVIFNFLSNAVKFTPDEGEVILRADRVIGADGEPRVRVSVLDTGPGIPADMREHIFEKFSQIDSGPTKSHQGTGLGLSIAREFAQLLQGEIQVLSESGRGSMFSLIVPLTLTKAPAESSAAPSDEESARVQESAPSERRAG